MTSQAGAFLEPDHAGDERLGSAWPVATGLLAPGDGVTDAEQGVVPGAHVPVAELVERGSAGELVADEAPVGGDDAVVLLNEQLAGVVGDEVVDQGGEAHAPTFPVAGDFGLVERGPQVEAAEFGEQSAPAGIAFALEVDPALAGFEQVTDRAVRAGQVERLCRGGCDVVAARLGLIDEDPVAGVKRHRTTLSEIADAATLACQPGADDARVRPGECVPGVGRQVLHLIASPS